MSIFSISFFFAYNIIINKGQQIISHKTKTIFLINFFNNLK